MDVAFLQLKTLENGIAILCCNLSSAYCGCAALFHNSNFTEFHESADFFTETDFCKVTLFADDFKARTFAERVERL